MIQSAQDGRLIRNIWAVGRNYADHAKELGNSVPTPNEVPLIFLKAGSSICFPTKKTNTESNGQIKLPNFSNDIHHELEIAFVYDSDYRFRELALALDLTARDLQNDLKSKGQPWTLAKSFIGSCPIGPICNITDMNSIQDLRFQLQVNGEIRQSGHAANMIYSIEYLRKYVLDRFPVQPGDLLLTGTPQGVGPILPGDFLQAELFGYSKMTWTVLSPSPEK